MTVERARSEALEYLVSVLKEDKFDPGMRAQIATMILDQTKPSAAKEKSDDSG